MSETPFCTVLLHVVSAMYMGVRSGVHDRCFDLALDTMGIIDEYFLRTGRPINSTY